MEHDDSFGIFGRAPGPGAVRGPDPQLAAL
jgi:hypothetical protein